MMRHRHISIVLALVLASSQPPANAEDRHALALELMQLFHVQETVQQVVQAIEAQLLATNPDLRPHAPVLHAFFQQYLGWAQLQEELVAVYAQAYSTSELRQLVQFFRTPVGQKFIAQSPQLNARIARAIRQRMQAHETDLAQMLADKQLEDMGP